MNDRSQREVRNFVNKENVVKRSESKEMESRPNEHERRVLSGLARLRGSAPSAYLSGPDC